MRSRGLLMLLLAGLAGLAAVIMVSRWMHGQTAGKGRVAVSTVEIQLGSPITPAMVQLVDWPQGSVPPGA
ncbi:MAG: Flp pilus assembly protein CpaB, partial [Burkholderiales bacterium]|nr:Flp pilus assembly protein CpaB [Burkholderiales bacterium]